MYTSYWLELWVPEASSRKIKSLLNLPGKKANSLVRTFEHHSPEEAHAFGINHLLDQFEAKIEAMEAAGMSRDQMSLWTEGNYEGEFSLTFDPMTLLRIGQESLKYCLTCHSAQQAQWDQSKAFSQAKIVDVRDLWVEEEATMPGIALVTVSFDDGTFWTARFHTYQWLARNSPSLLRKQSYYWSPNMILVPNLVEETVQKTIVEILRQQRFEEAFSPLEAVSDQEEGGLASTVDLKILSPDAATLRLDMFADLPRTQIVQDRHFWLLRTSIPEVSQNVAYLDFYLDLLEQHFSELRQQGIQRRDISLHLSHIYQDNCHLEFSDELFERMGRNGISLELSCQQLSTSIARCLE